MSDPTPLNPHGMKYLYKYLDPNGLADVPHVIDEVEWAHHFVGAAAGPIRGVFYRLVFTKSDAWAYEEEYGVLTRATSSHTTDYQDFDVYDGEIDQVFLGCCASRETSSAVVDLVRDRYTHARLFAAERAERRFALEFKETSLHSSLSSAQSVEGVAVNG